MTAILTPPPAPPGRIRAYVGILINTTQMIDAPHTGAVVRVEPYQWSDYLGATDPAG